MKVFQKSCLWLHWMKTRPRIRRFAVFWILLQYGRRIQAKGGEVRHPPYSALIHPSNLRYFLRIHLSFLYGSAILVSYPQSFYATTIKICWHYKYQAQPNSSDLRIKSKNLKNWSFYFSIDWSKRTIPYRTKYHRLLISSSITSQPVHLIFPIVLTLEKKEKFFHWKWNG